MDKNSPVHEKFIYVVDTLGEILTLLFNLGKQDLETEEEKVAISLLARDATHMLNLLVDLKT